MNDARPVALITGGARKIGRALANTLSQTHRVAISHRGPVPVLPDGFTPFRADFTDPQAAPHLAAEVLEAFGRIDLLVNNAGSVDEADCMAVNYIAPRALFDACLPQLSGGGCVVSISSMNARLPALSAPGFSASKSALENWTRWAAKKHGPAGIRINAVAPGPVDIPDAPRPPELEALFRKDIALGRFATPQDIAEAVRFLASDAAGAITGQVLSVCGGYRL
ncbi:SDR family NAD(P)-dependent oxidoreductase [Puniceibacterium sediminis]|uniref:3-oxoacyl-[acyl-carrier protein] reductase n=1 Tax=Puniceibacterium sediminis TaxID=1608407 RepID=A0A238UYY5_9RHOB|nr:SDR family oxidoreductase [Puniceibacterium sediminis]SNR27131.1 3-oxoacyl-[acyl-carrier protein] reductase [Puniceibacterium sediminis]